VNFVVTITHTHTRARIYNVIHDHLCVAIAGHRHAPRFINRFFVVTCAAVVPRVYRDLLLGRRRGKKTVSKPFALSHETNRSRYYETSSGTSNFRKRCREMYIVFLTFKTRQSVSREQLQFYSPRTRGPVGADNDGEPTSIIRFLRIRTMISPTV